MAFQLTAVLLAALYIWMVVGSDEFAIDRTTLDPLLTATQETDAPAGTVRTIAASQPIAAASATALAEPVTTSRETELLIRVAASPATDASDRAPAPQTERATDPAASHQAPAATTVPVAADPAPEAAPETAGEPAMAPLQVVTGSVVNVRNGPGTAFAVLDKLSDGTRVEVIATRGGWSKIRFQNEDTPQPRVGYMFSRFISDDT